VGYNPHMTPTLVPSFDPAALLNANLVYLQSRAAWENRRAVDDFNLARHNYFVQSQTGTPPTPAPASLVFESVDKALATNLFNELQAAGGFSDTIPPIESAITPHTVAIPAGALAAIAPDGSLSLTADPNYRPGTPGPVNPLGAPVAADMPGIVHATVADAHKDGQFYAAPDGSSWERLTSIVWGPIFVKVGR